MNKKTTKWSVEKEMLVAEMANRGCSDKEIAAKMNVSESAISAKVSALRKMGFVEASERGKAVYTTLFIKEVENELTRYGSITKIPIELKLEWARKFNATLSGLLQRIEKIEKEMKQI